MSDQQIIATLVAGRALIEDSRWWTQEATREVRAGGLRRCAGAACDDARRAMGLSGRPAEIYGGAASDLTVLGQCMNELRLAIPLPWRWANPFSGVVGYNDDPATTHADVIAVFDTAIGRARARIEATEIALGLRSHPSVTLEPFEGLLVP